MTRRLFNFKYTQGIAIGTISSLLALGLYSVIEYVYGKPLDSPQKVLILSLAIIIGIPVISVISLAIINVLIKSRIRPQLEEEVRKKVTAEIRSIVEAEVGKETETLTGIVKIFNNFRECESEILGHVKTSNSVRVFLQIGKTVLAGTTSFYDYLGRIIQPGAKVKILHANINSPYLSERIAHARHSDYREWVVDLEHAAQKIDNLIGKNAAALESREHNEGYVWRLFIFDDMAYIQPYLYRRDNSEQAPVLKLSRILSSSVNREENPSSLYKVFSNYFDFKWEEYRPNTTSLSELIPVGESTAVAIVGKYHQFYIFAIPSRYIAPDSKEVPFHGIGGKRKPDEEWVAAINREVSEETGAAVSIISSSRTHFHTTGAELRPVSLTDSPSPYCVYKRTREADPNFAHPEVLWLIGYEASFMIKSLDELKPRAEIGALVCLTGDMLHRTLQEKVTYKDIELAQDGSRLILGHNADLNKTSRAIPAGLAILVAAEQRPPFMRKL